MGIASLDPSYGARFRRQVQEWVSGLWAEKDERIERLKAGG